MIMSKRRECGTCSTGEELGYHMSTYFGSKHRAKTFVRLVILVINRLMAAGQFEREGLFSLFRNHQNVKAILASLGPQPESFTPRVVQKYKYFLLVHFDILFELASQYDSFDSYIVHMNEKEISTVQLEKLFDHFHITCLGDIRSIMKEKPRCRRCYSPAMLCQYRKPPRSINHVPFSSEPNQPDPPGYSVVDPPVTLSQTQVSSEHRVLRNRAVMKTAFQRKCRKKLS